MNYPTDMQVTNAWTKVGPISVAGFLVRTEAPYTAKVDSYDIVLEHVFESKGKNKTALPSWEQVLEYEKEKAAPPESFS